MEDLRECPFCECTESCVVTSGTHEYFINCFSCGAEGPVGKTEDEANRLWNTRADHHIPLELDEDGRCKYCGAGDSVHHSYTCPTGLHPDRRTKDTHGFKRWVETNCVEIGNRVTGCINSKASNYASMEIMSLLQMCWNDAHEPDQPVRSNIVLPNTCCGDLLTKEEIENCDGLCFDCCEQKHIDEEELCFNKKCPYMKCDARWF